MVQMINLKKAEVRWLFHERRKTFKLRVRRYQKGESVKGVVKDRAVGAKCGAARRECRQVELALCESAPLLLQEINTC